MQISDTSNQDTRISRKPGKHLIRGAIIAVICILTVLLIWFFLGPLLHSESSFDRKRLRFAKVERGNLQRELSVEGNLIASSYPTIYSPSRGQIQLFVQPGDKVEKGSSLATLDSPELRSELLQETTFLEELKTDLERRRLDAKTQSAIRLQDIELKKLKNETAKRELLRTEKLLNEGLIHKMEMDAAKDRAEISLLELNHSLKEGDLARDMAQLDVANMAKKLERQQYIVHEAQRKVDELEIQAPFNGIVGSLEVNREDVLISNQPILTLIDPSAFEIQIQIPENMGDDIEAGLPAEIKYEGLLYEGAVVSISPEVTQSVVIGRVKFVGTYPANMRQNQRVSVKVILGRSENVLKVKRGPFLESGNGNFVYTVEGPFAFRKQVQTGALSLTEVEIIEGIEEGETIVISDLNRFANAKKVFLRN